MEITVGAGLTSLVLFTGLSVFLMGMSSWYRGQGNIDAQNGSQAAVRRVANVLREAMSVTVDGDGLGVSYRMPQVDGDGAFVMPATWDGVDRRIELSGSDLQVVAGNDESTLCRGVITTDPLTQGGSGAYRIFTAGNGAITRSLNVMIVTRMNSYRTEQVTSRSRETVFLRNIPQLSR